MPIYGKEYTLRDVVQHARIRDRSSQTMPLAALMDTCAGAFQAWGGAGGLVDLEFLIHITQFRHNMAFDPDLRAALEQLVAASHLPAELVGAHDLITRFLIVSRLVSPRSTEPPQATRPLVARACGVESWDALLESYAQARQRVADAWAALAAPFKEE